MAQPKPTLLPSNILDFETWKHTLQDDADKRLRLIEAITREKPGLKQAVQTLVGEDGDANDLLSEALVQAITCCDLWNERHSATDFISSIILENLESMREGANAQVLIVYMAPGENPHHHPDALTLLENSEEAFRNEFTRIIMDDENLSTAEKAALFCNVEPRHAPNNIQWLMGCPPEVLESAMQKCRENEELHALMHAMEAAR